MKIPACKGAHGRGWLGGLGQLKVTYRVIVFYAVLLAIAWTPVCCSGTVVTIEHPFCRSGQVFIHWSDDDTSYIGYHIYRLNESINEENLSSAELVDANIPLGSAKDQTATYIAQIQSPVIGLRISDLGDPLDPLDGLWVGTIRESGAHAYAVLGINPDGSEDREIVPGQNSLAQPLVETPGPPSPVLEQQGELVSSGWSFPWKTYIWYRRFDEAMNDGEPTKLTITYPGTNMSAQYQTMLYLHAIGGISNKMPWWNMLVLSPCDFTPGLPHYGNSWWYGYSDTYPNITSGTVVNYSEVMLLHMVDWAKAHCPIDPNRLFLMGGSMGATGSVAFGLRHPEIFAGISAEVPQINPGLPGIGWSQGQCSEIWGSVSRNLPTNEGAGIWDRQNMTAYVAAHQEDLPFLKVQNSKNDGVLPWFQVPDFYKNLNASHHGFISAWGQGGHNGSGSNLPIEYRNFDIFSKIRLNQSYVAISNSSANNDPGNGDPLNGDDIGQMNAGYDWTILSDTAQEWSANISYLGSSPASADISARRLQQFNFLAGDILSYSICDKTTGNLLRRGRVEAQRARLFVIPQVEFDTAGRKLTVWKASPQKTSDVKTIDPNADVDIDDAVVTAVFPDVCYAQSTDRIPAIAITGASDLTEGSLIHLRGTKTTFGQLPAVNASPATAPSYGAVVLKPFGATHPFAGSQANPAVLGMLVKVWGIVREAGSNWFTLRTDTGATLVYDSIGTPPTANQLVTAVGIASETSGPNGESFGIRVRQESDVVKF